eukprot:3530608-Amphidinium_carterae.1
MSRWKENPFADVADEVYDQRQHAIHYRGSIRTASQGALDECHRLSESLRCNPLERCYQKWVR